VSQFTLLARTKKGTKPDFHGAANPEEAKKLYDIFVSAVGKEYRPDRVGDGRFQAMMEVALVNDGPVSFLFLYFYLSSSLRPGLINASRCVTTDEATNSIQGNLGAECWRRQARARAAVRGSELALDRVEALMALSEAH